MEALQVMEKLEAQINFVLSSSIIHCHNFTHSNIHRQKILMNGVHEIFAITSLYIFFGIIEKKAKKICKNE